MHALGVRDQPVTRARLEAAVLAHVVPDVVVDDLDVVVQAGETHGHVGALLARVLPRDLGLGLLLHRHLRRLPS